MFKRASLADRPRSWLRGEHILMLTARWYGEFEHLWAAIGRILLTTEAARPRSFHKIVVHTLKKRIFEFLIIVFDWVLTQVFWTFRTRWHRKVKQDTIAIHVRASCLTSKARSGCVHTPIMLTAHDDRSDGGPLNWMAWLRWTQYVTHSCCILARACDPAVDAKVVALIARWQRVVVPLWRESENTTWRWLYCTQHISL